VQNAGRIVLLEEKKPETLYKMSGVPMLKT
jgi:hypothetical protein